MTEERGENDFDPKRPSYALFIILIAIIIAALLIEWVFMYFKARM